MTQERAGSERAGSEHHASEPGGEAAGGFVGFGQLSQLAQLVSSLDAAGLVSGVGQAMAWARETVVAPHAAHGDPGEHPECVICRGMTMVQSATGQSATGQAATGQAAPASSTSSTAPTTVTRWVPVTRRERPAAS